MAKLKKIILLVVILAVVSLGVLVFSNMSNSILNKKDAPYQDELANEGGSSGLSKTQLAAQELAGLLVLSNPEGPVLVDGKYSISAFSPDDAASKILTEKVNEASEEISTVEVDEDRLIVAKVSDDAFWTYLTKTASLVKKTSELISKQGINAGNPSVLDFQLLANIYAGSVSDFYALAVPENLLFIHKERLRLLLLYENIFLNLAKYEVDPLSASVAISMLVQVDQDMTSLNQVILDIISKYKG